MVETLSATMRLAEEATLAEVEAISETLALEMVALVAMASVAGKAKKIKSQSDEAMTKDLVIKDLASKHRTTPSDYRLLAITRHQPIVIVLVLLLLGMIDIVPAIATTASDVIGDTAQGMVIGIAPRTEIATMAMTITCTWQISIMGCDNTTHGKIFLSDANLDAGTLTDLKKLWVQII